MASSSSSSHPLPLAIATAFTKQYYNIRSSNNSFTHKFYKAGSQISFSSSCNSVAQTWSFTSIESREDHFSWAANSRVDFENGSIDAQESVDGGILVVVTAEMYLDGAVSPLSKRLFVQTFFLKDDGKRSPRKNYYVFNDVFRFLDQEIISNSVAVVNTVVEDLPFVEEQLIDEDELEQQVDVIEEQQQLSESNGELLLMSPPQNSEEIMDNMEHRNDDNNNMDTLGVVIDNNAGTSGAGQYHGEPVEYEPVNDNPAIADQEIVEVGMVIAVEDDITSSTESVSAVAPSPSQKQKPPGSWASLVAGSSSKNNSSNNNIPEPITATTATLPSTTAAATAPSVSSAMKKNSITEKETEEDGSKKQSADGGDSLPSSTGTDPTRATGYGSKGSSSLYIKNVGEGTTEADLKNLFSEHPFKIVNVSFYPSRGYAFVDFADANAVNSIMKETRQTFHINGRAIEVEKKSTDRRRTGPTVRGGSGNNSLSRSSDKTQRSHSGRRGNGEGGGGGRNRRGGRGGAGGSSSNGKSDKRRGGGSDHGNNNNSGGAAVGNITSG